MKQKRRLFLALAILVLAATGLRADTVYSNFGPGYTDSGNAVNVAGNNYGGEYYFVSFTPSNTVTFTDAITDMLWFTGQTTLNAYLLADNSGMPGSVLDSMNQGAPV